MELEERQIETGELRPGMYVCRLDRPWTETPFPLQGFLIRDEKELATLRRYCGSVWIDVARGTRPAELLRPAGSDARRAGAPALPATIRGRTHYADSARLDEELPQARAAQDNAARLVTAILDDIRQGHKLDSEQVRAAVEPIVASVLRSADALFWVRALSRHDSYGYSHAINCCALAAAFGRHLGLPQPMLVDLATGGLLIDIGKAQLPAELLAHPGVLDPTQMKLVRTHVELSLQILDDGELARADVRDMIRTHHERFDGSGYPGKLRGTQIPLFGRMAAIVDSFDALVSDRPHARAITRHDALQLLYRHRNQLFQHELVEQFTACLGVYPVGSLVELSGGEVGVVMAQNPARRLRPRILLLTERDKQLRDRFVHLDLMAESRELSSGQQTHIVRSLAPGAHGLDPAELYL